MKLFLILLLITTYLFSLSYSYNETIICVSDNTIEVEKNMQVCDYCEDFKIKNTSISEDNCKDYKVFSNENFQTNFKIKFINKTIKIIAKYNFINLNYEYKISLKEELKKNINYYQRTLIPDQKIKHLKTIRILT